MSKTTCFVIAILAFAHVATAQNNNVAQVLADATKAYEQAPEETREAPKPKFWNYTVLTNLNFLQTSYTNWAKGGIDNYAMDAYIDLQAEYKKEKMYWSNRLQLDYGFLYAKDKPILQKNKDRILFESTWGHNITKTMNYTAKFIFLNQFTNGYTYLVPEKKPGQEELTSKDWEDARVLKSGFFAPADITLGLGIDWVPSAWLKINFAPLTGGVKVVADESLRKLYGMQRKPGYADMNAFPDQKDAKGLLLNGGYYQSYRLQFGAMMTADANIQINDNFTAGTQLILFSDYLNKPQNMRVNWTTRFMWKLAKYFTLNLQTDLIYDDNVLIVTPKHPDGIQRIQFLESLKFGFTYTFSSKK